MNDLRLYVDSQRYAKKELEVIKTLMGFEFNNLMTFLDAEIKK